MASSIDLISGASVQAAQQNIVVNASQPFVPGSVQPQSEIEMKAEERAKATGLAFPSDLPQKYHMIFGISAYKRTQSLTQINRGVSLNSTVRLPMPRQITDSQAVQYNTEELGLTGALGDAVAGTVAGGDKMAALGQAGASVVSSALGGGDVSKAVQAFTGLAPNQFLTVLLKGPQYKKHQFSWLLAPRSRRETMIIRQIIATFNDAMAVGLTSWGGNAIWTFPKVITPAFTNQDMLFKFKPCVLETFQVNYAPSGAPAFYTGTGGPDAVEISMNLLELEFWLAGQFGSGLPMSEGTTMEELTNWSENLTSGVGSFFEQNPPNNSQ